MNYIEIHLNEQKRRREYSEYVQELSLYPQSFYSQEKNILVIGGGTGVYDFPNEISANIVNIDLKIHPELIQSRKHRITHYQKDFIKMKLAPNLFDEIWALNSLPLYCVSTQAVELFFMKSVLSLKPGGKLRISPAIPNHVIDDGLIAKNISNKTIYQTFYKCMDEYSLIGGQNQFLWTPRLGHNNYFLEEMEILQKVNSIQSLSELKIQKYGNIRHKIDQTCNYTTALISKPIDKSDEINQEYKLRISKIKKKLDYPKIIVFTNNEKIRY